jgi:hypothetical protein
MRVAVLVVGESRHCVEGIHCVEDRRDVNIRDVERHVESINTQKGERLFHHKRA